MSYSRRSLRFVVKPSDGMLCAVCGLILDERLELACKHRICSMCSENFSSFANAFQCPLDGIVSSLSEGHISKQDTSSHLVYCKNWKCGCKSFDKLGNVNEHERICTTFRTHCQDCREEFSLFDLFCHVCKDCRKRKSRITKLLSENFRTILKLLRNDVLTLKEECRSLRRAAQELSFKVKFTLDECRTHLVHLKPELENYCSVVEFVTLKILVPSPTKFDPLIMESKFINDISMHFLTINSYRILNVTIPVEDLKRSLWLVLFSVIPRLEDVVDVSLLMDDDFVQQLESKRLLRHIEESNRCRIRVSKEINSRSMDSCFVCFHGDDIAVVNGISAVCKEMCSAKTVNQNTLEFSECTRTAAKKFLEKLTFTIRRSLDKPRTPPDTSGDQATPTRAVGNKPDTLLGSSSVQSSTRLTKDKPSEPSRPSKIQSPSFKSTEGKLPSKQMQQDSSANVRIRILLRSENVLKLLQKIKKCYFNDMNVSIQGEGKERVVEVHMLTTEIKANLSDILLALGYSGEQSVDIRVLFNNTTVGGIIGRGGNSRQALERDSKCSIHAYTAYCPDSGERIVEFSGRTDRVINCISSVYERNLYVARVKDVFYVPK